MEENPLLKLQSLGQSLWLDFIRRNMISSGELERLIREDGLRGMTSNPSIFEKAIAGSHDYDQAIRALALQGSNAQEIYQTLTMEDVERAADLFRPVHDRTEGRDGFVSIEVSPRLAHDTAATLAEARHLWEALRRPNVMIKVPATREGLPAIRQLVSEGINVNVTLLFGLPRYREVAEAFIAGLEERERKGKPLKGISSIASFFLSRIDVLIDPELEKLAKGDGPNARVSQTLPGQAAISSARVAYHMFRRFFSSKQFLRIAARDARPQRLLWASTGAKNPAYSDVMYVEALIGPETVNTLPLETLNAYRNHGEPALRLEEGLDEAYKTLQRLGNVGIDLHEATKRLEEDGVEKFVLSFDSLMDTIEKKRVAALAEPVDRQVPELGQYESGFQARIARLDREQFSSRLWRKDPGLWKRTPQDREMIRQSLGWLHVAEKMEEQVDAILHFAAEIGKAGFRQVVHMGMGGSSLAPMVLQEIFPKKGEDLPLFVLDTTDPAAVLKVDREIPLDKTLFIDASKSGKTAEGIAFSDYFYERVKTLKGDRAGENFVAITDPGTLLETKAREKGFRKTFLNFSDIGGRYSALSYFGLVPAALMGLDIAEILLRALRMEHACASCVPVRENPGVALGTILGELALGGRDKVTFLMPDPIAILGSWLEQLIAESTGKEGKGILPVPAEPPGPLTVYGKDRLFVYLRIKDEADPRLDRFVEELKKSGEPVVSILMEDRFDLGQEFLRWEIATATAGAILKLNPFDQPNVQESKDNTNRLLARLREVGTLPSPSPALEEGPLRFYGIKEARSGREGLGAFLKKVRGGDYVSLQAYLTETPAMTETLQAIRLRLRNALGVATTLGYGPRFLHSTGQFHKGGPNRGLFLQLIADDTEDVPIPGTPYTFGLFRQAQALGDLEALRKHKRRAVRIHLGSDALQGLEALSQVLEDALR
jgi:transaldolase / glucose-6-phosphate isomerase